MIGLRGRSFPARVMSDVNHALVPEQPPELQPIHKRCTWPVDEARGILPGGMAGCFLSVGFARFRASVCPLFRLVSNGLRCHPEGLAALEETKMARVWDRYLTESDIAHLAQATNRRVGFGQKPAL